MVSKQTRIWTVDGHEVQFDVVRFNQLFKSKAHDAGIGLIKYEEVVANALSVDCSTIHNWRCCLNGPSDPEKVAALEKFWNAKDGTLLKEVIMSKTEISGLTDRERAALKNVYISFKTFIDFFYNTEGFDLNKCDENQVYTLFNNLYETVELEYIDLKKKLYDALFILVDTDLRESLEAVDMQVKFGTWSSEIDPDEEEFEKYLVNQEYHRYLESFKKIVDPYLIA